MRFIWRTLFSAVMTAALAILACNPSQTNNEDDGSADAGQDTAGDGETLPCDPPDVSGVTAEPIAGDHVFDKPVFLTQAPGEPNRLYVVERDGRIVVVEGGEVLEEPFLDIPDQIDSETNYERGLLGLAFHPNYQQNGRFFIDYTPEGAQKNVAAEWTSEGDTPSEVRRLFEPFDFEDTHNGGMMTFGDDGYLWVSVGDGGGVGDPHGDIGNAQNTDNIFGSILRLDVDAPDRNFAAPDNPFVGEEGDDRIWAYGLRNPWRFSFDRQTGELYIADVGQDAVEEVSYAASDADAPLNYGWRAYEGDAVFDPDLTDLVEDHAEPIVTFPQASSQSVVRQGCSVTGGYVYRGETIAGLQGAYLYGDFCSRDIGAFRYCDGRVVGHQRVPGLHEQGQGLSSFGQDLAGNLYVLYHSSGDVKRIVEQ